MADPLTGAIATQPNRQPIDWSQPYSFGGTNWTATTPSRAMSDWMQAASTSYNPPAMDTVNYTKSAFDSWASANKDWLAQQGYTGGTSGLENWLGQQGYQFGTAQQGGTIAGNVFDKFGNPVGGGAAPGSSTGYDWGWTIPVGMFLGGVGLTGGFGGGAAPGATVGAGINNPSAYIGGGMTATDIPLAGAAAGQTMASAPTAAEIASAVGNPAVATGTAGAALSGLANPRQTATPGLGGLGSLLSQLGSGGGNPLSGLLNLLGGLYGYNQTKKEAQLPSLEEYLASPMAGAGEQAVIRSLASQGYQGSGNMMQAIAQQARNDYANYARLKLGQQQGAGTLASTQLSNLGLLSSGLPALFGGLGSLLSGYGGTPTGSSGLGAVLPGGGGTLDFPDVSSIWGGS